MGSGSRVHAHSEVFLSALFAMPMKHPGPFIIANQQRLSRMRKGILMIIVAFKSF
jgi:hypothetical protein